MREINGKVEGNLVIDAEDVVLHGIVAGHVIVEEQRTFDIHGTVIGVVTVRSHATVNLHGLVVGAILSHQGEVHIKGVVEGTVLGHGFTLAPNAVVHDYIQ